MRFEVVGYEDDHPLCQGILRTIERLTEHGGAHTVDIVMRKDAREMRFEGDWIKHLRVLDTDGAGDVE